MGSGEQTWRTFVRNHSKEIWACDFLTQYTALFAVAYVFVILEIGIFGQYGGQAKVESHDGLPVLDGVQHDYRLVA